jgi:hypothetical protein
MTQGIPIFPFQTTLGSERTKVLCTSAGHTDILYITRRSGPDLQKLITMIFNAGTLIDRSKRQCTNLRGNLLPIAVLRHFVLLLDSFCNYVLGISGFIMHLS